MASGVLVRAALSTVIYEKSLVISNQARVKLNNGKLLAHLSTDISRIDYCFQWFSESRFHPVSKYIGLNFPLSLRCYLDCTYPDCHLRRPPHYTDRTVCTGWSSLLRPSYTYTEQSHGMANPSPQKEHEVDGCSLKNSTRTLVKLCYH